MHPHISESLIFFLEPVLAGMVVGGVVLTILVVAVLSACYKRNGRVNISEIIIF